MILGQSLQIAQCALPLSRRIGRQLIELVHQLVGVLLSEFVIKLPLELGIDQIVVLFGLSPLHLRAKLLSGREQERLARHEISGILVVA